MFQFFGCEACGLLAPPEGVLTTVPPGKSHVSAFLFLNFWLHPKACGTLVPKPGVEPKTPGIGRWSLNHWATREVPFFS